MKATIIGIAVLIMATTTGFAVETCNHYYAICVEKTKQLGPAWHGEEKCRAARDRARKTGVFISPHYGITNPCKP